MLGRLCTSYYFAALPGAAAAAGQAGARPCRCRRASAGPVIRDAGLAWWHAAAWRACPRRRWRNLMARLRVSRLRVSTGLLAPWWSPWFVSGAARAQEAALVKQNWSFNGPFGSFDRAAAQRGLSGLQGDLLQLPFAEAGLLPQPRRHRPERRGAGQGDRRQLHVPGSASVRTGSRRSARRCRRTISASPFPERPGRARRQQRCPAAGFVGDHLGPRRRPRPMSTAC